MANQQATLTNIPLKASLNLNKIECDIKPYAGFHDDNALYIGGVKNNMYKKQYWDGTNDETKVFICHKDNKNYFAVNEGLNNIAVIENDIEENKSRLVALIDSADKFEKSDPENYESTYEKEITLASTGNTYLVNWAFQSGTLTIHIVSDGNTHSYQIVTACKSLKFDFLGNKGIIFTVYDRYAAKKITETSVIIYRFENSTFYSLNQISTDKRGFIWKSKDDRYLYVGMEKNVNNTFSGIQVFGEQELINNIEYTEEGTEGGTFTVANIKLSNASSLNESILKNVVCSEPLVRCNGIGVEVGIRRALNDYGGLMEDEYTYFNKAGNLLPQNEGKDYPFLSIAGDINYGLWSGGIQENVNDIFDITFYSGVPFCISSKNNRIKVEHNIDDILWNECNETDTVYVFENKKYTLKKIEQEKGKVAFEVMNDYIFFNVDSNENTVRLSDGKAFNRSDDYICLAIPYLKTGIDGKYFVSNKTYALFASGYHVLFSRDNYSDIGMVLAPLNVKKAFTSEAYSYYMPSDYNGDILAFWGKTSEDSSALGVPIYYTTLLNGYDSDYENVYYPVTSSNVIYNPSILDEIEDTYFDEYLFYDGQYSYVSTRTQNQSVVLGYYIQTLAEFNKLFIIAGTHYAVQGNYIIRLDIQNGQILGVSPLAYIGDFQYIGVTVTEALFWSPIDKSFYTFRGDLTLTKFLESNRIDEIYSTFSQPSLSCVVCATNDGILFFYGDQMIRLPIETKNRIYYTNSCFIIDNYEYCFLKREGYTKEPIKIESEFYSSASYVEETNDCLYITLFDEEPTKGKVELSCMTLKEGQFKSERKIFDINPSMFDKSQNYLRLRYQPQYQTGAFSFQIVSDYPIANLAISHRVNNIGNSRYND